MEPNQLGKYTLIQELGRGGFGTVYKATDPIGRTVAIKVLKPGWVDDPGVMARFRLEALAAGELFHTRISTILDFDVVNDRPFLVMRFVDGRSLDKVLAEKGALDWDIAIRIIKEVADGLDFAHQHGFIHRDIKPANIIYSEKEGAVLTDFGLVKAAQVSGLSSSEVLLGSPNYIAPEVWGGKKASRETDIYSLGCVFYEMITGKILFAGDSSPQIMTRHVLEGPKFPPTWPEKIPSAVERVLQKALMMEPSERFSSAVEFASALSELRRPTIPQPQDYNKTMKIESPQATRSSPLGQAAQPMKPKGKAYGLWAVSGIILLGILFAGIMLGRGFLPGKYKPALASATPLIPTITVPLSTPAAVQTPTLSPLPPTATPVLPSATTVNSPTVLAPTETASISLPALVGTPLPQPVAIISKENASRVVQLARFGKGSVGMIAWSPDGNQIAVAHSFGVYILFAQGLRQKSFFEMPARIVGLAYSPDGTKLAVGRSDNQIQLIQADSGNVLQTVISDIDTIRCVAFSLDGKYLISGTAKGGIWVWRTEDNKLLYKLESHTKDVTDIAISPDGKTMASGSSDTTIKLWNIADGSLLNTLAGHTSDVNRVAFSPDGQFLASGSNDSTGIVWRVKDGVLLRRIRQPDAVTSVAFSPDGQTIATASRDTMIRLRNPKNGALVRELKGHLAAVNYVMFSRDGTMLASISNDGILGMWSVADGQMLNHAEVGTGLLRSVQFTLDNKLVAAGTRNGTVQLWDLAGSNEIYPRHEVHDGQVNSLFPLPGNEFFASGSDDKSIRVWSVTGFKNNLFAEVQSPVESVAISPDNHMLAAGSFDGNLYVWNLSDSQRLKIIKDSQNPIWSVAFSPDNTLLAAGSLDGWVHVWKTADWSPTSLQFNLGKGVAVYSLAFSPDGSMIAFSYGDQGTIRIYNTADGTLKNSLVGHAGQVWSMCFTTDSQVLVSGSLDSSVRLWQVSDGSLAAELWDHRTSVSSVTCSTDGKMIASGSWDGTIRIWGIAP